MTTTTPEYRECSWSPSDQDACPFCAGEACGRCGPNPNPPCNCDSLARHEQLRIEPMHEEDRDLGCPGCGYLMDGKLWPQAAADFDCPRCGRYRLSEFRYSKRPAP